MEIIKDNRCVTFIQNNKSVFNGKKKKNVSRATVKVLKQSTSILKKKLV